MRCFIAIPCPGDVRARLAGAQKQIAGYGGLKLVECENIHLTLKFLGETDETKAQQAVQEMKFIESFGKFTIRLKGIGAFPNTRRINVVWAGVEDGKDFIRLHDELDARLSKIGFAKDQNFHPHFTLARAKALQNPGALGEYLQKSNDIEFGQYAVDAVLMMESRLTSKGPIYSIYHEQVIT
ncbi:MAG: RNA 2',3'-cyclic phosphodiesterase [Candidatus Altiarchaeota archaeon]|nr:RNA 2',3'-cyclic phosphodiesterase [Candidatus Altiarchaeota archaeon]